MPEGTPPFSRQRNLPLHIPGGIPSNELYTLQGASQYVVAQNPPPEEYMQYSAEKLQALVEQRQSAQDEADATGKPLVRVNVINTYPKIKHQ